MCFQTGGFSWGAYEAARREEERKMRERLAALAARCSARAQGKRREVMAERRKG